MSRKASKNINTVLSVLDDEVKGDVASSRKKLTRDYKMTWVYRAANGELFPSTSPDFAAELKDAYQIQGRQYDVKNIAEGKDVVMVEMVESYPDLKTKKVYRTPLIIVLEMQNGKIRKGRHYCDPDLSYLHLTKKQIERAY